MVCRRNCIIKHDRVVCDCHKIQHTWQGSRVNAKTGKQVDKSGLTIEYVGLAGGKSHKFEVRCRG